MVTPVNITLILANVIISLVALSYDQRLLQAGILRPYVMVRQKLWYQIISSAFLHANLGHLFVNMITLFFFGSVMERSLGPFSFLLLYLFSLIVSSLPSVWRHKDNPYYATLGASGAVEGVLFAFIFLYPFESIYLFLIPIPIPAILFGVLFIAYSIYESKRERGQINHEAHIAGAASGLAYMFLFVPNAAGMFIGNFL